MGYYRRAHSMATSDNGYSVYSLHNATNARSEKRHKAKNVIIIRDKCHNLMKVTNVISNNVAYDVCRIMGFQMLHNKFFGQRGGCE